MQLKLLNVDGRDCVPVRLLPFVTDWEPLSADNVAHLFAGLHPFHKWSLVSFNLHASGAYTAVRPASWVDIAIDLEELARELAGQPHSVWRRRAVDALPAAVFVWLADLKAEVSSSASSAERKSLAWRRELNFAPLLSTAEHRLVFEGFEVQSDSARILGSESAVVPAPELTAQAVPAPACPASRAVDAPPVTPSCANGLKNWLDIALPYIVPMLKSKQFGTAKELFHALEAEADSAASPFAKGAGPRRGELYLRELSQSIALKTFQNRWGEIRAAASLH